jgi:hypothetical protein
VPSVEAALVDIVREFLVAHQLTRTLFARYREETLEFSALAELIGDGEDSVLFRLKERCHKLFREAQPSTTPDPREVLFDLAVGSLFHESMSFRENFYQRVVYGPRVEALRAEAGAEADGLFRELKRILASVAMRLEEGLVEVEGLLERTRDQLAVLLVGHKENGYVARYLIENEDLVADVFSIHLDEFLVQLHGESGLGYEVAGRSYLYSGHYEEARGAFVVARDHGVDRRGNLVSLEACAAGMRAYLDGSYSECVASLSEWIATADKADDPDLVTLANAAVSRIGRFLDADADQALIAEAAILLEKLGGRSDHDHGEAESI